MRAHGCLEPEVLAAYADHGLSLAERAHVETHLASCPQCTALLAGVVRTVAEIAPVLSNAAESAEASPLVSWRAVARAAAAAAAVLGVLAAPSLVRPWLEHDAGLVGLAGKVGEHRSVLGRLTGGFPHAPLDAASAGGQDVRASETDRVLLTAGRIRESVGESATPSRLHALGVAQFLERRYDDAAQLLLAASREQPANARYLNDVATVQLERARRGLRPDDLPRALAAADRARRIDPALHEAWFNRALALSALSLNDQAKSAWAEYLRRDNSSPWAGEARKRLEDLSKPTPAAAWEAIEGRLQQRIDATAADAAVRAQTTEARKFIEDNLFGAWANDVLAGNNGDGELERLRVMADAMRRVSGDALYSDAVGAIDRAEASGPDTLTRLARAHRSYSEAASVFRQDLHEAAAPRLDGARAALAAAGSAYQWRAAVDFGASSYFLGQSSAVAPLLEELRSVANSSGFRFVAARASWQLGLAAFQQGRLNDARGHYDDTLQTSVEMGDQEQAAAAHTLLSGVFFVLGDKTAEWQHRLAALDSLPTIRSARARYAVLAPLGFVLRGENPQAALAIQDALVQVVEEFGSEAVVVDLLAQRSSTLITLGRADEARQQLAAARARLERVRDQAFKRVFELPVLAAESDLHRQSDPAQAAAAAQRAIETADARGERARLPQLHLRLAKANIVWGKVQEAEKSLVAGIQAFDETRARQAGSTGVAAFDEGWQLFETAVQFAISRGDFERAFALAEQGRRHAASGLPQAIPVSLSDLQRAQPRDQAVIALMQFDDEVAVWVIRQDKTQVVRRPLSRADAGRIVARQQDEIRFETNQPIASATLYDEIVRPLSAHLASVNHVVFVPDQTYQDVSFAALWDGSRQRFLIEQFTLSAAPNMTLAAAATTRLARTADSVLVVSTDADTRLPSTISDAYRQADLALGASATTTRLLGNTRPVLHLAVPAQRNTSYPAWSHLVMTDEPGRRYSGALPAREIARRPMPGTQLVVLDEVRTQKRYRTAGTFDLATAFLTAGVQAVLGTLPGADEQESRELMVGFHRQLASQVPAAEALARVQRNALQQNGRRLGAWTALVIYGSDR